MTGGVVIAGRGWRVSRFVIPALVNAGVAPERIAVVRKTVSPEPAIDGIREVTDLAQLGMTTCALTINCVAAPALLSMQRALVARFPEARHVCDTPILEAGDPWQQVAWLGLGKVSSLEDWPSMPNLAYVADAARRHRGRRRLAIEHFGIPGHFLSLFRALAPPFGLIGQVLSGTETSITGTPRRNLVMSWTGPKQFVRAKVSLRTEHDLVEDFHEVEPRSHDDAGVVYRVVSEGRLQYFQGARQFDEETVRPDILASFEPFSDRKNVHELDKFIAVTRIVRRLLGGRGATPYGYFASALDASAARSLADMGRTRLW